MKTKQREIQLPKLRAQVAVAPSTLNEEARTVEVIFYSGAAVDRFPFFDDPYTLQFSLEKDAVRLDRFNSGAPLVDNHRTFGSVSEVMLGVVQEAWLAKDGGHARVKIAEDRPDIVARLKDGILRNFSMGAVIHQMRDITEKGDAQKRLLAIDWEPMELSIVPAGADPAAQALSDQKPEMFRCSLIEEGAAGAPKGTQMNTIKVRLLADIEGLGKLGKAGKTIEIDSEDFNEKLHWKDVDDEDGFAARQLQLKTEKADALEVHQQLAAKADKRKTDEAIEADNVRGAEIKRLAAHFNLDAVWAQRHIKLKTSIDQVILDATEARAKLAPVLDGGISLGEDFESIGWRTDRMAEALAARAGRKAPPDAARDYVRFSIAEMAFECLSLIGRTRGRGLDARRNPRDVIHLALHTQSDFPLLMANALNKALLADYLLAAQTFREIAAQKTFNDLRPHPFLRAGDFPTLLQVDEHGEFKSGTMSETSESVTAITYGRILGISRQLMINDDVGAFNDIAQMAGRRVGAFQNQTFYLLCILAGAGLGPTMSASSGGVAVYNAAHLNLVSAGALDNPHLEEALGLMLNQKSIDGIPLNAMPKFLLVAPAYFGLAKRLLATIQATKMADINPFAGDIIPITDANLTGTRFYVLADPAQLPNYVYGSLEGQEGPRTEVQNGFRVDGIEVKVAIDFGCGAIEYRGGVSGAGA